MFKTQSASKLSSKSVNKIKSTINAALGRLKQPISVSQNHQSKYKKIAQRRTENVQRSESTRSLYSHKCKRISEKQLRTDRVFSTSTYSPSYHRSKDLKTGEMKANTRLLFNEKDHKFQRVKIDQKSKKNQKSQKRSIIETQVIIKNSVKSDGMIGGINKRNFIKSYSWIHSEGAELMSEYKEKQGKKLQYFAIKCKSDLSKKQQIKQNNNLKLIGSIEDNFFYVNTAQCSFVVSNDKQHFINNKSEKIQLHKNIEFILILPNKKNSEKDCCNHIEMAKQIYCLKEDGVQSDQTIVKVLSRNLKQQAESFYLLLIRLNRGRDSQQLLSSKSIIDEYKKRLSKK